MIEPLQGYSDFDTLTALQQAQKTYVVSQETVSSAVNKAKDEFLTIFYKELLKQAFKPSAFGINSGEESENSSFFTSFNSDVMIDKMAAELAKNNKYSTNGVMQKVLESGIR